MDKRIIGLIAIIGLGMFAYSKYSGTSGNGSSIPASSLQQAVGGMTSGATMTSSGDTPTSKKEETVTESSGQPSSVTVQGDVYNFPATKKEETASATSQETSANNLYNKMLDTSAGYTNTISKKETIASGNVSYPLQASATPMDMFRLLSANPETKKSVITGSSLPQATMLTNVNPITTLANTTKKPDAIAALYALTSKKLVVI